MKNSSSYSLAGLLLMALLVFLPHPTQAVEFDHDFIISDEEFLDSNSMTVSEIDAFLKRKGGYIAFRSFPNYEGVYKTAAEIIYEAANNYDCENVNLGRALSAADKAQYCKKITINPKALIVLLQKEQSLIEEKNPTQRQLDWAVGYGCPDGQACNKRWEGIGKQINSASLQFFDYMQNPHFYTYKAGGTYTVSNTGREPIIINPVNQATAALYNYTPHVYNGNYNFWKLWNRFFSFQYTNNTLLQVRGEPGVWLIQNGFKRPFLTKGALTTRYDLNKVIQVNKSVIDQYPTGASIRFPQFSLVRSPHGTIFLLVDDTRRGFDSGEAFRKIGFNPEEVIDASWDDINSYTEGKPLTATSSYPTGALLQDKTTGGVYYVTDGTKAPLWDAVLLKTRFKGRSITTETPEKLASYQSVEPAIFSDGELLKTDSSPAVFIVDNKTKRPIVSGELFESLGYKWQNIISVPKKIIDLYPDGDPIVSLFTEEEAVGEATSTLECIATSTPDMIGTTTLPFCSSTTAENPPLLPNDGALAEELNDILNP